MYEDNLTSKSDNTRASSKPIYECNALCSVTTVHTAIRWTKSISEKTIFSLSVGCYWLDILDFGKIFASLEKIHFSLRTVCAGRSSKSPC